MEAIVEDPRTKPLDLGELAGRRLQNTEMNKHFVIAIQLEDALPYMEPPFWHHPVSQIYGAALLVFATHGDWRT